MAEIVIEKSWKKALEQEFEKQYFTDLTKTVRQEYLSQTVFPAPQNIFRAFDLVPFDEVKVVILGQDPYHTPGVADGLAFSTLAANKVPPSLQNIYKEIISEFSINSYPYLQNPDLTRWATQGVFLLNNTLTVESGKPNSHASFGWNIFTDSVISTLSSERKNLVFMLWGNFARGKKILISDTNNHLILESPHPSPFSAHNGFFGNNHFMLCNEFLESCHQKPIEW
jgi:uracil-DNA glycosylase